MADTWIGVVNTVRPDYIKGYVDMTIRKRLRLAMLRRRGKFEYNQSGDKCVTQLKYSKPQSQGYADGSTLDFGNHSAFRRVELNWRGTVNTDSLTMMQHSMNTGEHQLINLFQDKSNNIMSGIEEDFHGDMFKDGEAADRLTFPHGLETFLGAGTVAATDIVAQPSDTYGLTSLSTVLGNEGGSWNQSGGTYPNATVGTDWPDGSGSQEYDFNSPVLLNWSSSNWGTGSTTWEANCWRVISQGITWMNVNSGSDGTPDLVSLSKNLFQGYKEHHEAIRRINIPHKEAQDLGFSVNVLNQDGVAVQCEFDVPHNIGYIENLNNVSVASLMPDLFWLIHGYDKVGAGVASFMNAIDLRTLSLLMAGGFFGNLRYRPKYVAKLKNYA